MEKIIERLKNWSIGIPQPPVRLEIWISGKCNLRCKFCGTWQSRREDTLTLNDFLRVVNEARELGVEEVYISGGGEPFMRKNATLRLMKEIKRKGMKGYIITNGTLLSKDEIEFIVKIKWDEIAFSFDCTIAETNDYLRGRKGCFNILVKNIQYLSQLKKEKNSSKPEIFTNTVIVNKNYKKILEIIRFGKKLGVNSMIFQPLMNTTDFCKKLELSKAELEKLKNIARKTDLLAKKLGINSNIGNFVNSEYIMKANSIGELFLKSVKGEKGFLSIPCFDPWWHMTITHDGKVGACAPWAQKSPENVLSSSLKDIWFGKYFNSFRERIKSKNLNECWCCVPYVFHNNELRVALKKKLGCI
jgi:MoaA/NifB/PqqE/SkfB family radical SAM enzyme